jgi:hypothetical protein
MSQAPESSAEDGLDSCLANLRSRLYLTGLAIARPKTLYHYTSADALIKIVTSGHL